jgi:hypothetical protein
MITTSEFVFSDAEVTVLARMLEHMYFPATMPPELDDDGWKAVTRGLVARGAVHGHFRQSIDDDVRAALDLVFTAGRSLWTTASFAPGAGETRGIILWINGDLVVQQTAEAAGPQHIVVSDASAVDDMLAVALDFPATAGSQAGEPVMLPIGDYASAVDVTDKEGCAAAAGRFPVIAEFLTALDRTQHSAVIESRRNLRDGGEQREMITLAESPEHDLWLAHNEPYAHHDLTGVMTRVQRVSLAAAGDEVTALAKGTG